MCPSVAASQANFSNAFRKSAQFHTRAVFHRRTHVRIIGRFAPKIGAKSARFRAENVRVVVLAVLLGLAKLFHFGVFAPDLGAERALGRKWAVLVEVGAHDGADLVGAGVAAGAEMEFSAEGQRVVEELVGVGYDFVPVLVYEVSAHGSHPWRHGLVADFFESRFELVAGHVGVDSELYVLDGHFTVFAGLGAEVEFWRDWSVVWFSTEG